VPRLRPSFGASDARPAGTDSLHNTYLALTNIGRIVPLIFLRR